MSDEKTGGKWASEIYDFFRIFRRINSTLYGLLLVEIGWVLLLVFITKLTPTGGNTPMTPIVSLRWPFLWEYRVVDLFLPGAALWALAWVLWSGLITYLWFFIRRISAHTSFWFFVLIGFIATVINVFLLWIVVPIEFIKAQNFIRKFDPNKKTIILEEQTTRLRKILSERESKEENWLNAVVKIGWQNANLFFKEHKSEKDEKKLLKRIKRIVLYNYAVEEINFNRWFIHTRTWNVLRKRLNNIHTQTYIGFAPIESYSYEEDIMAAKAPAQAYSSAIDHMRMKLAQIELMKFLHFDILPNHFKPSSISEASFMRKILGFDLLLWGSYIEGQPNKIWLNIAHNVKKPDVKNKTEDSDDASQDDYSVFPLVFNFNYSKMVVDQSIFLDTYAALIIAVIQLKARIIGSENKGFWARLIDLLRYRFWDMDLVINHLVFDVFPKLNLQKRSSVSEDDFPSIPKIIVEIIGRWIGNSTSTVILHGDRKRLRFIKNQKVVLLDYMKLCISAFPEIAQNYYRAGFLACLLGKSKEAVEFFENAKKHERIGFKDTSLFYEITIAGIFLRNFNRWSDEFYLAAYAALIARAINLGDADIKISENVNYQKMRSENNLPDLNMKTTVTVLDKLFSNEYKPGR
jgi:hypothetical protein